MNVYIIGTLNGVEKLRQPWPSGEADAAKHIDQKSTEFQAAGHVACWADGRWIIGRGDEVITLRVEVQS